MTTRLAVADALAAVLGAGAPPGVRPLGTERVALDDALGRVLARDVTAPADVPPWDNASMDGFAVRAADVLGAGADRPAALRVVGEARAGAPSPAPVGAGQAVRIATGAPIPAGADTVVRVEDTRGGADASAVLVLDDRDARDQSPGGGAARRNVRPRGEDLRTGVVAAAAGTRVTPGVVGLLAAAAAEHVEVARRPRVAIVASGDELVPLARAAEAHAGSRVVSANTHALAALVRDAGGVPRDGGIAADRAASVREHLAAALALGCDVLLTTGGVSVGDHDHVRPAVAALGGRIGFWGVRMRPGGPLAFGQLEAPDGRTVPWLGLPGNPVSTVVTFALFVGPLLAALEGDARPFTRPIAVALAEEARTAAPLTHLLRATLDTGPHAELEARLTGPQGSGLLSSVARADALVIVPAHIDRVQAGSRVWALPLTGPRCAAIPAHVWTTLPGGAR